MQARNKKDEVTTLGFINLDVQVQAADGTWYSYKGGIPITDKRECDKGLIANPAAIEDPKRVKVSTAIHILTPEPKGPVTF